MTAGNKNIYNNFILFLYILVCIWLHWSYKSFSCFISITKIIKIIVKNYSAALFPNFSPLSIVKDPAPNPNPTLKTYFFK